MKLTPAQVRAIKRELKGKTSTPLELAQKYGVSRQTIYNIKNKRTWKKSAPLRPPKYVPNQQ